MIISNPVMVRAKKLIVMIQCELFTHRLWDWISVGDGVIDEGNGVVVFKNDLEFTLIYLIPKLSDVLVILIMTNSSMSNIPFQTIDWSNIPKTEHKGETGNSYWQTLQWEGLRVRIVEYSAGYLADHWCRKGHIVHCLEGEFVSEMEDGSAFTLMKGMTYIVSDNLSSHRSISERAVKLLIVDGDFLK